MLQDIIKAARKTTDEEITPFNIIDNPVLNNSVLRDKINTLDTMSDEEFYNILKETYQCVLEDIFKRSDRDYLNVFTTPRFLNTLIRIFQTVTVTNEQRIYCNKLAYDYITLESNNDAYVKELFFVLSKIVNRDVLPGLLGIGIDENLASYIALARYSSLDEKINIMRINVILMNLDPKCMPEELIIKIYGKLFDRLSILFEAIMFTIIDFDDDYEITQEQENIMEQDSTISLAILDILETQPSNVITGVLKSYALDFQLIYGSDAKKVRFSLKNLSNDYSRIRAIVEYLETEGIYIP